MRSVSFALQTVVCAGLAVIAVGCGGTGLPDQTLAAHPDGPGDGSQQQTLAASITEGPAPLTVEFSVVTGNDTASAADGDWQWDFGDGNNAEGAQVTHTFCNPGTYVTKLCFSAVAGLLPLAGCQTVEINVTQGSGSGFGCGGPLTRTPLAAAPVANPDAYAVSENTTLQIGAADGVLVNDTDPDNLPLTAVRLDAPSGLLSLQPDGSFSYTPPAGFNGQVAFQYKANNGQFDSSPGTVTITVNRVNNAPSFTRPENQVMDLGQTLQIVLAAVSPGPSDEAAQAVTFTATSNNQSIVPDTGLVFNGSTLSITPVGSGIALISIVAHDDGGTDNGGANASVPLAFAVTVIDPSGPSISGRVILTDTAGHRPAIGPVDLAFTGTGLYLGANFTATSDFNGNYSRKVPVGWTGTISAARPDRAILLSPSEYQTIDNPVTPLGLVGQDLVAWTAPIGIPMPEFGIKETHYMYAGQRYDFNGNGMLEAGEEYPDAGNGPYTHYVDNSNPMATDVNNAYGTPAKPRMTIPLDLKPGQVVEVHGSSYNYGNGWTKISGAGTAAAPIFCRCIGSVQFTLDVGVYSQTAVANAYIIMENFHFAGASVIAPSHHICIRNCTASNSNEATGMSVATYDATLYACSDVVLYNNVIGPNGNWQAAAGDLDKHATNVTPGNSRVWILDNKMFHCEGDGSQANGSRYLYLGRNLAYQNKQCGFWTKTGLDVVMSQNEVWGIVQSNSATGEGLGCQYGASRVWFLYNEVHDCNRGIAQVSSNGEGPGDAIYAIGNLLHDIGYSGSGGAFVSLPANPWYIVNNTVYNATIGLVDASHTTMFLSGNIFAGTVPLAIEVDYYDSASLSTVQSCLFSAGPHIDWVADSYTTLPQFVTGAGQGQGCLVADPAFVDAANKDFRLTAGSPAVDAAAATSVYDTFYQLYGLDISVDFNGLPRPQGFGYDMGAFER